MGSVAALLRYPVKSARSEHLESVDVGYDGLRGDRLWACVDATDGTVGSAKDPARWGALLTVATPDEAGMVPDWFGAAAGTATVTEIAGARPGGRFTDFGAVHLISTGSLRHLAAHMSAESVTPPARFRPNLVVEAPADPEPCAELRVGDVVLRVIVRTPRCAIPGLGHHEAGADRRVLPALARHFRTELPGRGRAACFGVYAEVLNAGEIAVGQRVVVE